MQAGEQLGEYIIEAEIGGGGMAKVYRARHSILDTVHALKVLDDEYRANAEARRRFLDEAKIQAKHLTHPNIVKVTNIVATANAAALVMELVDGGSLEDYIQKRKKPFTADDLLQLAVPILDAMAHAHDAGIIHRDIKPANVLLRKTDGRLVPAITDFGIAKLIDTSPAGLAKKKSTHHEARMGTLGYMSPEQIRKAKDVTARSDIFSLGAMFYEMATGRAPFEGDSDFDIMEKIVHGKVDAPEKLADASMPPHIIAAIRRAMDPAPEKRFASCREMSAVLTGGKDIKVAGVTAVNFGKSGPVNIVQPAGSKKWPLFLALALAGVGLAGGAIFMATRGSDDPKTGGGSGTGSAQQGGGGSAGTTGSAEQLASVPPDAGADPWTPPDAEVVDAPDIDAAAPIDAYVPDAPPKVVAPPVVYSCKGRWSGSDLRVAITGGRSCGSITFTGGAECVGSLSGCSDGRTFSASYSCRFRDMDVGYSGTISMGCTGSSVSASVYVNGKLKQKNLSRGRITPM
ncbi:MAG: serine/threonine protein kinase [Deltaproteobacteria bacterium]|nr:serine/threonine protein kinase [Deltaproteobacteria bacterium]